MVRQIGGFLLLGVALAASSGAQHAPGAPGVFAFADSSGTRLITLGPESIPDPGRLTQAACGGGVRVGVAYVGHQAAKPNSGRDIALNFDRLGGFVFRAARGRAVPDRTCVLLDAGTSGALVGYTAARDGACGPDLLARVAHAKPGRQVVQCRRLIETSDRAAVIVVQFAGEGKNALASLMFVASPGLVFEDFPGSDAENSTWRVDDGGEFDTTMFDVLCVLRGTNGVSLAYTWAGFEGESIALVVSDGTRLRRVLVTYRYWSPS